MFNRINCCKGITALPRQRRHTLRTKRAQRRDEPQRFQQIRLPLPICAEQKRAASAQIQLRKLNITKVLHAEI